MLVRSEESPFHPMSVSSIYPVVSIQVALAVIASIFVPDFLFLSRPGNPELFPFSCEQTFTLKSHGDPIVLQQT